MERARGRALSTVGRRTLDRFFGWLCRTALAIFFRRIEVVGRDRLPPSGPRIVVGNHVNGLIDPLFVLGPLRVPARLLGKKHGTGGKAELLLARPASGTAEHALNENAAAVAVSGATGSGCRGFPPTTFME